jgi:ribosomal protein S27AE
MYGYLILAGVVGVVIILYLFSVMSRKTYKCPRCGERLVGAEYLSAKRCGMCGAPLEQQ